MIVDVLVIIICVVIVAVAVARWIMNKEKSETMTEKDFTIITGTIVKEKTDNTSETRADVKTEKKTEDKSGYAIRYSDNYGSQAIKTITDPRHKISVILKDGVHEKKWICPNCEAENHMADSRCCVCNFYYKR